MNVLKKRIILINSFRRRKDITHRFNIKRTNKPHYFIDKNGEALKFLDNEEISTLFLNKGHEIDILICLENFGWLEKINREKKFINPLGVIVDDQKSYEKKWRDYFFWDIYTEDQISSLLSEIKSISNEMQIKKNFIGHNTKTTQVENFNGIVTRSNFNELYTDVSPAFPFSGFNNQLKN